MDIGTSADTPELQTLGHDTVCVLALDAAHCIEHVNPEFEEACGYRRGELLGQPLEALRHPDMPGEVLRDIWATLDAGATWVAPVKWLRGDGRALWTRTSFAPMSRRLSVFHSMVVSTHVPPLQARAAEAMYRAMQCCGLAWRARQSHRGGGLTTVTPTEQNSDTDRRSVRSTMAR